MKRYFYLIILSLIIFPQSSMAAKFKVKDQIEIYDDVDQKWWRAEIKKIKVVNGKERFFVLYAPEREWVSGSSVRPHTQKTAFDKYKQKKNKNK